MTSRPLPPVLQTVSDVPTWVDDLKSGAQSIADLESLGIISEAEALTLRPVASKFKFRVGRYYLSLIDRSDPACPIRKQIVPDTRELYESVEESPDPTGDEAHRATPLLIHRYPDRALLMPTLNCPMYCRYCFRKVGLNESNPSLVAHWQDTLNYLESHATIEEVIFSGGDPLMLSDRQLRTIFEGLATIKHLRRLRIHTRVPVTLPYRVTETLADILGSYFPVYVVTHFNHPRELTPESKNALATLRHKQILLANQSVLLKGVNDSAQVLKRLYLNLTDQGVRPYYLHHPDVTVGTGHLRLSLDEGRTIYAALRGSMSGLSIPSYVMEIPGGGGKIMVESNRVQPVGPGRWRLHSPLNQRWEDWRDPAYFDFANGDEDLCNE